jgi:hypothetical protein
MTKALAYFITNDGIITHVTGDIDTALLNEWFTHYKIAGGFMKFHDKDASDILEEIARLYGNFEISYRSTDTLKTFSSLSGKNTVDFFRAVTTGCSKNQSAKLRLYI